MQGLPDERTTGAGASALARGASTNLVGYVVRVALVLLHSLLAARLFGAEAYGIYSEGVAAAILVALVGQAGMGRTVTRYVALYQARGKGRQAVAMLGLALVIALPLSSGLGLAMRQWAGPLARLLGEASASPSYRVLGLAVPVLTLVAILSGFSQGLKDMLPKVLATDVLAPAAEVVGVVALAWLGLRQIGLPLAYALSVGLSALPLLAYVRARTRGLLAMARDNREPPAGVALAPVLGFAVPVLAVDLLNSASSRVAILLVGVLGTSAMVGVFTILQRLIGVGTAFLQSLSTMFSPMVADLVERRRTAELAHLYKASTRWILGISLPFFLVMGFFGAEVLRIFGREFVAGAGALPYLVGAQIFNGATGLCATVLMMSGHPQYSSLNEGLNLGIVVVLLVLLVPRYGVVGAVWAFSSGVVLVNALRVIQVWWHLRIHPFSWPLVRVGLAGAGMGLLLGLWKLLMLRGAAPLRLLALGALGALAAYLGLLCLLGLEPDEKQLLRTVSSRLIGARR